MDAARVSGLGPPDVETIGSGYGHSCASLADGTVECWGWNSYDSYYSTSAGGQLGDGRSVDSPVPVVALGVAGAVEVSVGWYHTFALFGDGSVASWGDNEAGQLGDGSLATSAVAIELPDLVGVVHVSGGWMHSCAILGDGTAWCWGGNGHGQLGDGLNTATTEPVAVAGW